MMKTRTVRFRVALTPYGRASLAVERAKKDAELCECDVKSAGVIEWREAQGDFYGGCVNLAKIVVDGKRVCARHAAMLLLEAAVKGKR
jgi:hypothetical protein